MTRQISALLLLAALGAAPAAAIDGSLEGAYDAKFSCAGIATSAKNKTKFESTISLVQSDPSHVVFQLESLGNGVGYVLTNPAKATEGTITATSCTLAPANLNGVSFQADAKIKPSGEASLKGTAVMFAEGTLTGYVCKFSAKRTTSGPIKIVGCP